MHSHVTRSAASVPHLLQPLQQKNPPHELPGAVSALELLADMNVTLDNMKGGKPKEHLQALSKSFSNQSSTSIYARFGDNFQEAPLYSLMKQDKFPLLHEKYHTALASVGKRILNVLKNAKSNANQACHKYLKDYQAKRPCLPAMQQEV